MNVHDHPANSAVVGGTDDGWRYIVPSGKLDLAEILGKPAPYFLEAHHADFAIADIDHPWSSMCEQGVYIALEMGSTVVLVNL